MKKVIGKPSQCAHCGKTFKVKEEERVMYCKEACEKAHDLFSGKVEKYVAIS
ncbi:hypothetical protein NLX69_24155 [Rossellomorea sp. BNER]|nr:hypothetical protein [Rossellomorea sp. BNER]